MESDIIIKKDFYDKTFGMLKTTTDEVRALAELDALCYDAGLEYDEENIEMFLSEPGVQLVRFYKDEQLIAFQLSNIRKRELTTIDVHPKFRKQGLGRKLLKTTLEEFMRFKCKKVHCQIAINNTASIMLHLKFGFKIKFMIPLYYPDGTSAYWFEKDFLYKD